MQTVIQLLLDLCIDPPAALERIPEGDGLPLTAGAAGTVCCKKMVSPGKLSDYWRQLYSYASILQCCDNFLSATKPSAPCLLCHPFGMEHASYLYAQRNMLLFFSESVVQTLEIQDDDAGSEDVRYSSQEKDKPDQQVEVHVLQSGQIDFSTPVSAASETTCIVPGTLDGLQSAKHRLEVQDKEEGNAVDTPGTDIQCCTTSSRDATQTVSSTESSQNSMLLSSDQDMTQAANLEQFSTHVSTSTSSNSASTQLSTIKTHPLITGTQDVPATHDRTSGCFVPLPSHTSEDRDRCDQDVANNSQPLDMLDTRSKPPRRSTRRHRSNNAEETTGLKGRTYNLRLKQNLSGDLFPPVPKKRQLDECDNGLGLHSDPLQWGVAEVTRFISAVPRCNCSDVFREHVSNEAGWVIVEPLIRKAWICRL